MTEHSQRTEELIAAAAADDLSAEEQAEFDALRAADPSVDASLHELTDMLPTLGAAVTQWDEADPPHRLGEAVRRVALESDPEPQAAGRPRGRGRRRTMFALAAGVGVVAGVGGTMAVESVVQAPPDGPPGTYGAVEEISFGGQPSDVEIAGNLIAHTWGTETVLEIEGLQPGESFAVVLVSEDGEEFASGTFFGSEVLIECRMNAAIMRDEVDRVEITDDDDDLIARAELPEAIDPEAG